MSAFSTRRDPLWQSLMDALTRNDAADALALALHGREMMDAATWDTTTDVAAMLREVETRRQWFDTNPPHQNRISDRKLRLFAVACCRSIWPLLTDPRSRTAVETAEKYSDGRATDAERQQAQDAASEARQEVHGTDRWQPAFFAFATVMPNSRLGLTVREMVEQSELFAPAVQAAILRQMVSPFSPLSLPREEHQIPCPDCEPGEPDKNCDDCGGEGTVTERYCPWLTEQVRGLALAAYTETGRKCGRCNGHGRPIIGIHGECPDCGGSGTLAGRVDPDALNVLCDALEEVGCDDERIIRPLRGFVVCEVCHVEERDETAKFKGWHVLDALLNKE